VAATKKAIKSCQDLEESRPKRPAAKCVQKLERDLGRLEKGTRNEFES